MTIQPMIDMARSHEKKVLELAQRIRAMEAREEAAMKLAEMVIAHLYSNRPSRQALEKLAMAFKEGQ